MPHQHFGKYAQTIFVFGGHFVQYLVSGPNVSFFKKGPDARYGASHTEHNNATSRDSRYASFFFGAPLFCSHPQLPPQQLILFPPFCLPTLSIRYVSCFRAAIAFNRKTSPDTARRHDIMNRAAKPSGCQRGLQTRTSLRVFLQPYAHSLQFSIIRNKMFFLRTDKHISPSLLSVIAFSAPVLRKSRSTSSMISATANKK